MRVNGFQVTPEIESACLERMKRPFRIADIRHAAWRARKPGDPIFDEDRIADRLIQRERKAGNIKRDGTQWVRTSNETRS